jgi:hypothetical protein
MTPKIETRSVAEEWKVIPQFPNYEASNLGRIRRVTDCRTMPAGAFLKTPVDRNGYLKVSLSHQGKVRHSQMHRIVAETWLGNPPTPYHEVAHNNGIKTDCRVINLRWATKRENAQDRAEHGFWNPQRGSIHHSAKLNEEAVMQIRQMRMNGVRPMHLAEMFNVSRPTISGILSRKTWSHVV